MFFSSEATFHNPEGSVSFLHLEKCLPSHKPERHSEMSVIFILTKRWFCELLCWWRGTLSLFSIQYSAPHKMKWQSCVDLLKKKILGNTLFSPTSISGDLSIKLNCCFFDWKRKNKARSLYITNFDLGNSILFSSMKIILTSFFLLCSLSAEW